MAAVVGTMQIFLSHAMTGNMFFGLCFPYNVFRVETVPRGYLVEKK